MNANASQFHCRLLHAAARGRILTASNLDQVAEGVNGNCGGFKQDYVATKQIQNPEVGASLRLEARLTLRSLNAILLVCH